MTEATAFWQENQVGGPYITIESSERALLERKELFPNLYTLMPVAHPGKTILDYGCGPGHDSLLFLRAGAAHVYYADISWLALKYTTERLELYGYDNATALFADDDEMPKVDYVHCAGVIHHVHDPIGVLRKLRRALREGGAARFMVYDGDLSDHSQSDVPITEWWTHTEFLALCKDAGFERGKYLGSYECSTDWRPNCQAACYWLQ